MCQNIYSKPIEIGTREDIWDIPFTNIKIRGIVLVDRDLNIKGYFSKKIKNNAPYYTNEPITRAYIKIGNKKKWFSKSILLAKYGNIIVSEFDGYWRKAKQPEPKGMPLYTRKQWMLAGLGQPVSENLF